MLICDSHLHLPHSSLPVLPSGSDYCALSCVFSREEAEFQKKIIEQNLSGKDQNRVKIFTAAGIHPQNPDMSLKTFLTELLESNECDAVGECGFDFYTQQLKQTVNEQEKVWKLQLKLALDYNKPLVIHGRKSAQMFFRDIKELKKLKAVVFHSWAGTLIEALSMLDKGVNAYFSFGKPLINGKKSASECVKKLPAANIFLETDAPYQTLKGEDKTLSEDILKVYEKAFELRGEEFFPDIRVIF